MARVLALVPDLLFGSRLQGALTSAGHDVELLGDDRRLLARLSDRRAPAGDVLVIDLTRPELDGAELLRSLAASGELGQMRTLGLYAHVEADVRARARDAGFDLVVPRSRMAREGAALLASLLKSGAPRPEAPDAPGEGRRPRVS